MRKQFSKFTFTAALMLAITFTFSCSSGDDGGGNSSGGSCDINSYKNKKMPDGKIWMTENLNCKVTGSECYKKEESNCNTYGRLYSWEAAKKACSGGWHLPSDADWNVLIKHINPSCSGNNYSYYDNNYCAGAGTKLKARDGWNEGGNGTDKFGFSALPGGGGESDGDFFAVGDYGFWWSASDSEDNSNYAYDRYMDYGGDGVGWGGNGKDALFSVRCVKD